MLRKIAFVLKIILIIAIPALVCYLSYTKLQKAFLEPADPNATEPILYELMANKSFKEVCKELEKKGFVKNWWSLNIIARLQRSDTKIKAGEYELSPSLTPIEIVSKFAKGEMFQRRVTIVEGSSIWETGVVLETAGIATQQEFEHAIVDTRLTERAGIGGKSFEGYLFPETYFFSKPISVEEIIIRMVDESNRHWSPEFALRAEDLQMSRHQILTLASIIEKESGSLDEQPLVSSVFHNRLKVGMKLQADPTVAYAIPDLTGSLTKAHLEVDSPYNTYSNIGLPPGPICNPGLGAIKAALYPQETEYLYFVADGQGTHFFAKTLDEHNQNVRKYRQSLQLSRQDELAE